MNKWETAYLHAFTAFVNTYKVNHCCELTGMAYIFEDKYKDDIHDLSRLAELVADTASDTIRERMVKDLSQGDYWDE